MTLNTSSERRQLIRAAVTSTDAEEDHPVPRQGGNPSPHSAHPPTGSVTLGDPRLAQVLAQHVQRQEAKRFVPPPGVDMTELISLIVEPSAELLHTSEGRDLLQLMAHLVNELGVRAGTLRPETTGPRLVRLIEMIQAKLREKHCEQVTRARVSMLLNFIAVNMADRAKLLDTSPELLEPHGMYVEQLIRMATAAVTAP